MNKQEEKMKKESYFETCVKILKITAIPAAIAMSTYVIRKNLRMVNYSIRSKQSLNIKKPFRPW